MYVESVEIRNFRSFANSGVLPFSAVNVLVGRNNSGKSSVLHALYAAQAGTQIDSRDVRAGAAETVIEIGFADIIGSGFFGVVNRVSATLRIGITGGLIRNFQGEGIGGNFEFPNSEPRAFFYPLFSRRPISHSEGVAEGETRSIRQEWTNLAARLDMLTNNQNPLAAPLAEAMREVIGVELTAVPSSNGKRGGYYVSGSEWVYVDRMGAGVLNAAILLTCLVGAKGRAFLIEEPETDLHPAALRALLRVIEGSSTENQFFISTHSHVVLRHLGGLPQTTVFKVSAEHERGAVPTSSIVTVPSDDAVARKALLDDLGYELSDFDLYDGWLIFEESSAERLIRDYFLKWYHPMLVGRLRTISTRGIDAVEATFDSYRRLFLYAHLERVYHERAWVAIDGGPRSQEIVDHLRRAYPTWSEAHFRTFAQHDFEAYYPPNFAEEVDRIAVLRDDQKREAKRSLLDSVLSWIESDEQQARDAFAVSAAEVIGFLSEVAAAFPRRE